MSSETFILLMSDDWSRFPDLGSGFREALSWRIILAQTDLQVVINSSFRADCLNAKSERSTGVLQRLNSAVRLIQRTTHGGSSETLCITSDLMFTRSRSAIA